MPGRGGTTSMGKLVPFANRQEQAEVAAALERAGEQFQRRLRARDTLPQVLAALIQGGQQEAAVAAVVAWGSGRAAPEDLLDQCEQLAAVAGIAID